MFLIYFIQLITTGVLTPLHAHCPNAFTHNSKTLCVGLEWEKTDVLKGESMLSPVLNSSDQKPFKMHHSNLWLKIWTNGDTSHKLLFVKDLKIRPFMLMSDAPSHYSVAKGGVEFVKDQGYFVSEVNFVKMKGCWTMALESDETATEKLFYLIAVKDFNNLSLKQNAEQEKLCTELMGTLLLHQTDKLPEVTQSTKSA
jgi:hypothetical protein